MTQVRRLAALVATALVVGALLAACSGLVGGPSLSASATPTGALGSSGASVTPEASIAVATAQTATVHPDTFNPYATPTQLPPATPYPSPQPAGIAGLIYAVTDQLGRPDWCDPDFYPLPRADELSLAKSHLDEIQADTALYATILEHNSITPGTQLTDDELVTVYADWKMLTKAITLTPAPGGYTFDYTALQGPDAPQTDHHVVGAVASDGTMSTTLDEPTSRPNCPICLARGTLIGTPTGAVPVEQLAVGMPVWTQSPFGVRVSAPVIEVGSTLVPTTHMVVHLVLADGRTVDVSPGHPLPDGRVVGSLRPADPVDGTTVVSADLVPYSGGATFDLLPAGATGTYWANGILLGSTLFKN